MSQLRLLFVSTLVITLTAIAPIASAALGGGGGHALGIGLVYSDPNQADLNTMITNANSSNGGITTGSLGTAWEIAPYYMYRFSGTSYALLFRPSYFSQTATGSSAAGASFNYSVTGYSFFPILRMYPLENSFMHFFLQYGMGYANLTGSVTEGSFSSTFGGGAFGAMAGLGAEFCFTDSQCLAIEGNGRYLPVLLSTVSASSGTPAANSMTRYGVGQEAELQNEALKMTMSGIQGVLAYTFKF